MTLSHTKLADPQQLPSSSGALYTNPVDITTFIKGFLIHNTNTTAETVTLNVVPNSGGSLGSASAANRVFRVLLAADETLLLELLFPIVIVDENDAIFGDTTTASKVTFIPLGDQEAQ